jgi:hypothetical protein
MEHERLPTLVFFSADGVFVFGDGVHEPIYESFVGRYVGFFFLDVCSSFHYLPLFIYSGDD